MFPDLISDRFRRRVWTPLVKRAGLPDRRPKDLRSTFATQLRAAGVQVDYIQQMLGHADDAITRKHYAQRAKITEETYADPIVRHEGEVTPDLLARIEQNSHQKSHHLTDQAWGDTQDPPRIEA